MKVDVTNFKKRNIAKEIEKIFEKISIEEKLHPDIIRNIFLTQFACIRTILESPRSKDIKTRKTVHIPFIGRFVGSRVGRENPYLPPIRPNNKVITLKSKEKL